MLNCQRTIGGSFTYRGNPLPVRRCPLNQAVWTNLIEYGAAAKLMIDLKFRAVFSQRKATLLNRLSLPKPCSMRARAL
jgi:hypothetical protein